jgi:hypothetical protein
MSYLVRFILYMVLSLATSSGYTNGAEVPVQHDSISSQRVVVSMTSLPHRLQSIRPTIESILVKQTLAPTLLQLNLPYILKRMNVSYPSELPSWLRDNPKIKVHRSKVDYGPLTKLFPTLLTETDPHTIIIIVDDDTIYSPKLIESMVKLMIQSKGLFSVSGRCGDWLYSKYSRMINFDMPVENLAEDARHAWYLRYRNISDEYKHVRGNYDMVFGNSNSSGKYFDSSSVSCCCRLNEAFAGVAFRRHMFSHTPTNNVTHHAISFEQYVNIALKNRNCFVSDDWVVSNFLTLSGIFGMHVKGFSDVQQLKLGFLQSSEMNLHSSKSNGQHRYLECAKYLHKHGLGSIVHSADDNFNLYYP